MPVNLITKLLGLLCKPFFIVSSKIKESSFLLRLFYLFYLSMFIDGSPLPPLGADIILTDCGELKFHCKHVDDNPVLMTQTKCNMI